MADNTAYAKNKNVNIASLNNLIAYYNSEEYDKCYETCIRFGEHNLQCSLILGYLYWNGHGVEKDRVKGIRYLISSGFPKAKEDLPTAFMKCLKEGVEIPIDLLPDAVKYLNIKNVKYEATSDGGFNIVLKTDVKVKPTQEPSEEPVQELKVKNLIKIFENN